MREGGVLKQNALQDFNLFQQQVMEQCRAIPSGATCS